jgi:hypothetical protein
MDVVDRESEVLLPRAALTRRGFVMTSLVTRLRAIGATGVGRCYPYR